MRWFWDVQAFFIFETPKIHHISNYAIDIKLGSIVELMLTGYAPNNLERFYHPIHIHGNSFFVLAQEHGTYGPGVAPGGEGRVEKFRTA